MLVPYFRAGLENNEFCVWVTSGVLREEDAEKALRKAVSRLGFHEAAGQMEILPFSRWQLRGGKTGRALLSRIDKAIARSFEGLRIACDAVPAKNDRKGFHPCGTDFVPGNKVIALYTYPRGSFDALGLMEVVKNHRFALVRNAGGWEIIESSEARTVREELERSDEKLKSIFRNMLEGFAYHRIVLDSRGKPSDYIFLEVNDVFERLTGLKAKRIIGKRATAVLPGIEKDPAGWIAKYGKVALSGKPVQFESYAESLQRWFAVSAFSPHRGYFALTFTDITRRRQAEEALKASLAEKETLLKELAHRTKNNLQVVGSLLSLQAVSSADEKLLGALADIQDRIRAMALVHERLYRSGNFASLNMRDYVGDLMTSLLRARQGVGGAVRTELELEDIFVSIDAALPCGLIISELVSNSLKHAFPDRESGAIFLSLRSAGEKIELRYGDDGPGLPRDLDLSRTRSLGLKLVYNLAVRQLRGAMEIRRDPGSEFVITFGGLAHVERA